MPGNDGFFSKNGMTANAFNNTASIAEYGVAANKDAGYTVSVFEDNSSDNSLGYSTPPRMALQLRTDGRTEEVMVPPEPPALNFKPPAPMPPSPFSNNRMSW